MGKTFGFGALILGLTAGSQWAPSVAHAEQVCKFHYMENSAGRIVASGTFIRTGNIVEVFPEGKGVTGDPLPSTIYKCGRDVDLCYEENPFLAWKKVDFSYPGFMISASVYPDSGTIGLSLSKVTDCNGSR